MRRVREESFKQYSGKGRGRGRELKTSVMRGKSIECIDTVDFD
jgi:hypothetical protein|tara:strand:- start:594 stop:722 length:129 start_codon:yes stop_codon:yes gene_type:complete